MTHHHTASRGRRNERGFTLIEMIVVSLLLLVAMLGLLAVFDASARINKNETDVADAQGNVRYGIYQMTRVVRMAGTGGLYLTQAVLNHNDAELVGILPTGTFSYDNVNGVTITDADGGPAIPVKNGTDMLEIRGVILSPLIGFAESGGCNGCTGTQDIQSAQIVGNASVGFHQNDDATNRPQFQAVDDYTATATAAKPMYVIVEGNTEQHGGCGTVRGGPGVQPTIRLSSYPQFNFNVGLLTSPTNMVGTQAIPGVNFGGTAGPRFNVELPSLTPGQLAGNIEQVRRAGILDDILFFIGTDPDTDPTALHPFLAQAIRRGDAWEISRLADDVEDMQVAYGLDLNGDNAISRLCPPGAGDDDPNVSTVANCDEWRPNSDTEVTPDDAEFQLQDPFSPDHSGGNSPHCPRLHAVMISLLAKAKDSDPGYKSPGATGVKIMNSTATPVTGNFRRRVQTLKVNLRNYAFQG